MSRLIDITGNIPTARYALALIQSDCHELAKATDDTSVGQLGPVLGTMLGMISAVARSMEFVVNEIEQMKENQHD